MNKKGIFVILAVLMLIFSAAAVSADDIIPVKDDDIHYSDGDGQEEGAEDSTNEEDTNGTDDGESAPIVTSDENATNETDGVMPLENSSADVGDEPTGNPLIVLLAAIAGIGLTTLRRK